MNRFFPFKLLITTAVYFCNQAHSDDVFTKTIKSINLDSANLLLVEYTTHALSKADVIQPPLYALPPGMHQGSAPHSEIQTFDIILVKDKTETSLGSFQQIVDPSVMEGVYTGERIAFFNLVVRGNTVHYIYTYKGLIHVV